MTGVVVVVHIYILTRECSHVGGGGYFEGRGELMIMVG